MCRELPNLSLAGYWWHSFFPESIRQIMGERLGHAAGEQAGRILLRRLCGRMGLRQDQLIKKLMAQVYGQRVEQGQFSKEEAIAIARAVLYETRRRSGGMTPEFGQLKA